MWSKNKSIYLRSDEKKMFEARLNTTFWTIVRGMFETQEASERIITE